MPDLCSNRLFIVLDHMVFFLAPANYGKFAIQLVGFLNFIIHVLLALPVDIDGAIRNIFTRLSSGWGNVCTDKDLYQVHIRFIIIRRRNIFECILHLVCCQRFDFSAEQRLCYFLCFRECIISVDECSDFFSQALLSFSQMRFIFD